jgi:hypothetical protein
MKKAFILWLSLFFIISASSVSAADKLISVNLGAGSYTASSILRDSTAPEFAFDNSFDTKWNAGEMAPAWIEVDLGEKYFLSRIKLYVHQSPSGETTHDILVSSDPIGNDRTNAERVKIINGNTKMGDQISVNFESLVNCRYVQIHTIKSPSWVGWYEIRVFGTK